MLLVHQVIYLENQNYKAMLNVYKDLIEYNIDNGIELDSFTYICYRFQNCFYQNRLGFLLSLI